jgi:peptide/nickel transport system permease protein
MLVSRSLWRAAAFRFALACCVVSVALYLLLSSMALAAGGDGTAFASGYIAWLEAVLRGDLGFSARSGEAVTHALRTRAPATAIFILLSVSTTVVLATCVAWVCALAPGGVFDRAALSIGRFFCAVPPFVAAVTLVAVFAIGLGWAPSVVFVSDTNDLRSLAQALILPVVTVSLTEAPHLLFSLRRYFLVRRRNEGGFDAAGSQSIQPVLSLGRTILAGVLHRVAPLLGTVIVLEAVFVVPGIGRLLMFGVNFGDPFIVQGTLLCIVGIGLLAQFLAAIIGPDGDAQRLFNAAVKDFAGPTVPLVLFKRLAKPLMWLALVVSFGVLAPWLGLSDPDDVILERSLLIPDLQSWFGSDAAGRDVFSRVAHGAHMSLVVLTTAVAVSVTFGGVAGGLAGRAWSGALPLLRFIGHSIPAYVVLVLVVSAFGVSVWTVAIGLAYVFVAPCATWAACATEHFDTVGAEGPPIISATVLRPMLVQGLPALSVAVSLEATLGFMRLGVPAAVPGWGAAIAHGQEHIQYAPHISAAPAFALVLTTFCLVLVADALEGHSGDAGSGA